MVEFFAVWRMLKCMIWNCRNNYCTKGIHSTGSFWMPLGSPLTGEDNPSRGPHHDPGHWRVLGPSRLATPWHGCCRRTRKGNIMQYQWIEGEIYESSGNLGSWRFLSPNINFSCRCLGFSFSQIWDMLISDATLKCGRCPAGLCISHIRVSLLQEFTEFLAGFPV